MPTADMQPVLGAAREFANARLQERPFIVGFPEAIDARLAEWHRERVRADLERRAALEAMITREASDLGERLGSGASLGHRRRVQATLSVPAQRGLERATVEEFHRETGWIWLRMPVAGLCVVTAVTTVGVAKV